MPLKPKELGQLFLEHYPVDEAGYSQVALMDDLVKISPDFRTTNGCQWARSGDGSWLGRQFEINRELKNRRVFSIQLVGYRTDINNHSIPTNIVQQLSQKNCAILDIGTNIEIDHKNGRYNQETYNIDDFQPLCKTCNDAKRQHCKECLANHKRYDAKRLGYNISFWQGDEDSDDCVGCYWNDIKLFNQKVSVSRL